MGFKVSDITVASIPGDCAAEFGIDKVAANPPFGVDKVAGVLIVGVLPAVNRFESELGGESASSRFELELLLDRDSDRKIRGDGDRERREREPERGRDCGLSRPDEEGEERAEEEEEEEEFDPVEKSAMVSLAKIFSGLFGRADELLRIPDPSSRYSNTSALSLALRKRLKSRLNRFSPVFLCVRNTNSTLCELVKGTEAGTIKL